MSNGKKQRGGYFRGFLSCRQILSMLTMIGFMVNYALRVNLTLAIVEMVQRNESTQNLSLANSTEVARSSEKEIEPFVKRDFSWNIYQTNFLIGSFYCGYVLTELPGGRLAELIGGHRVFGHSMLWASLLTLITPLAAHISYIAIFIVRVVLGFMLGASWPAIHPVAAVWIPPMERSKFMSNMMASSLGAAVTMPCCGYLISIAGWSSAFYLTGGVGLLWSLCWFTLVFETPAVHPRISPEERREIQEAIGTSTSKTRPTHVPWREIFTSRAVWAIIICHGLSVFSFFTVVNQLPTFIHDILHFDIKKNGMFSSLPYLGKYIMALSSAYFADFIRKRGMISCTATRKMFTGFALITPGLLMIVQVFLGKTPTWSVTIFTLSLFAHGAVTAGYLGNGLDIAPNFSGTIFGLANTLSSIGGFLSTWIFGALLEHDKSYHSWQIIFWVLAFCYIAAALWYIAFGTGELQAWNNPAEKSCDSIVNAEEGVPLKQKE